MQAWLCWWNQRAHLRGGWSVGPGRSCRRRCRQTSSSLQVLPRKLDMMDFLDDYWPWYAKSWFQEPSCRNMLRDPHLLKLTSTPQRRKRHRSARRGLKRIQVRVICSRKSFGRMVKARRKSQTLSDHVIVHEIFIVWEKTIRVITCINAHVGQSRWR